ncbi:uncharacterized protein GIQ15_03210 [Arthroderma uncinatum]|uniref:uncharacterized protein n=1 Tax=Arthroderma uncinatum TaxID=74035 RepID=UPI00144AC036|nr:uncharacterized protein GIQ15_03210 [Arthroderma uncinatum]KAF3483886.1 hypothetical protein GIQ15_03210 [Arthroderma uncinatum]
MPMHLCLPAILQRVLAVLLPLSLTSLCYLYLYPLFHGCAFPLPATTNVRTGIYPPYTSDAFLNTVRDHIGLRNRAQETPILAPFRLLVLADPQLEGDTSLPKAGEGFIPQLRKHWKDVISAGTGVAFFHAVGDSFRDVVYMDIPRLANTLRKQLDLIGNDYYLAHIYRTLRWWSRPTHVTVLGDLIGSQWVSDEEFGIRSSRYWNRTFRGGVRVPDDIMATGEAGYTQKVQKGVSGEVILDIEPDTWSNRIINIVGNHDIGYAGDISQQRMDRFDREFGRANWDVRFNLPAAELGLEANNTDNMPRSVPSIHLVVLNTLTFDTPALDSSIQGQTYQYLNGVIDRSRPVEDRTTFTLLLTHLPLHKKEGTCTDPPYFSFHERDDERLDGGEPRFKAGGLKEQNHLSDYVSHTGILQGIFGMSGDTASPIGGKGRNGLILTGHDHTGCDVVHYVDRETASDGSRTDAEGSTPAATWSWNAKKYSRESSSKVSESASASDPATAPSSSPSIREVTLRSMMGEFGGNAGLLSVWFDADPSVQEWKYEITTCQLGVQHIWWAVHIVALITFIVASVWIAMLVVCGKSVVQEHKASMLKPPNEMSPRKRKSRSKLRSGKGTPRSSTPKRQ